MDWNTIIPVFTFILGLLGKIFYDMWHDSYIEKKKRRKEDLEKHYADLEENIIKPMINGLERISNSRGHFYVFIPERQIGLQLIEYKELTTMKSDREKLHIFKLHFPQYEVLDLLEQLEKHNTTREGIKRGLRQKIEDKCKLPVRESTEIPHIEPIVVDVLFEAAWDKVKQTPVIDDSEKMELTQYTRSDPPHWILKTNRGVCGRFHDETEARLVQNSLIELEKSGEVEQEIQTLWKQTQLLEREMDNMATHFKAISQYGRFGQPLKRNRNCPICQVIFS